MPQVIDPSLIALVNGRGYAALAAPRRNAGNSAYEWGVPGWLDREQTWSEEQTFQTGLISNGDILIPNAKFFQVMDTGGTTFNACGMDSGNNFLNRNASNLNPSSSYYGNSSSLNTTGVVYFQSAGINRVTLTGDGVLNVGSGTLAPDATPGSLQVSGYLIAANNKGLISVTSGGSDSTMMRLNSSDHTEFYLSHEGYFISGPNRVLSMTDSSGGVVPTVLIEGASGGPNPTVFAVRGNASQVGSIMQLQGQSSTAPRQQADLDAVWIDATDATRKARLVLRAWDTAAREGMRVEADGAKALIGIGGPVSGNGSLCRVNGTIEIGGNTPLMTFYAADSSFMGNMTHDGTNLTIRAAFFQTFGNHGTYGANGVNLANVGVVSWASSSVDYGTPDVQLQRAGAGILSCDDAGAGSDPAIAVRAMSSTTMNRDRFRWSSAAVDNTDAARKYRATLSVYDTAVREAFRAEADGAAARLGFYGAPAVARQLLVTGAGATVDQVITALQNLGLLRQS